MGCDYCLEGRTWKPLFRIIETYAREVDVFMECENCDKASEAEELNVGVDDVCDHCDFAPVVMDNVLNITIFISDRPGELIFEDKERQCTKYRQTINYCPVCGRRLSAAIEGG